MIKFWCENCIGGSNGGDEDYHPSSEEEKNSTSVEERSDRDSDNSDMIMGHMMILVIRETGRNIEWRYKWRNWKRKCEGQKMRRQKLSKYLWSSAWMIFLGLGCNTPYWDRGK